MSDLQSFSPQHVDLITSLSFSSSSPSLLVSTSLDGWIRIHARTASTASTSLTNGKGGDGQAAERNSRSSRSRNEEVGHGDTDSQDEWSEVGNCKANDGPVWRAIWGPREYGTSILVSIAGSVVDVWGMSDNSMHCSQSREKATYQ